MSFQHNLSKQSREKYYLNMYACFLNSFQPGAPFVGTKANSIAPDETPQNAASNLGLFCLLTGISSKNGINFKITLEMKVHSSK